IVVFENYPVDPSLGAERLELGELEAFDETNYPLTLVAATDAASADRELVLRVMYDTARFRATSMRRMLHHLRVLVEGMADESIGEGAALPLVTAAERHQLLVEWNAIPRAGVEVLHPPCLHERFAAQVERTPDAVAVVLPGPGAPAAAAPERMLSYRQLNERANRLAHHLVGLGVGPEVRVGLCLERSPEMVIGLLAILKAGGAYVPLEPSYPAERLAFILEDAGISILLAHSTLLERLPAHAATVVCPDAAEVASGLPAAPPRVTVRPENPVR
ncbi:MAG: AMP-binding protein, partial [bacterium]|nr:AMP-binding protein [bacterium]